MKRENYFDPNPAEIAENMINKIASDTELKRVNFKKLNTALLVIDMQRYFVDPEGASFLPSAPSIISNVNGLISSAKSAGIPVFMTRHINTPENAGMMRSWWKKIISKDDPDSKISRRIDSSDTIPIIKTQFDAFYRTELEEFLKDFSIDTLIFAGVIGHLCVETTVRSAFVRGFSTIVAADATADYNAEMHESVFRSLAHGFSEIALTHEIIERIGS